MEGWLGMGSPVMDQRVRDDAQDLGKTYKQVRDITVGQHVHKQLPNGMTRQDQTHL